MIQLAWYFAVLAAAAPVPVAASLCKRSEAPLFSCQIGARMVSVCNGRGGAVYRYGRPDRIELQMRGVRFAARGYSGGGESQLVVRNRSHRYIVYDRTVRTAFGADGRNDPQTTAGLIVQRAGRTLSNRQCRSPDAVIGAAASRLLPPGEFVEH